jgi:hypothetical protein
LVEDKDTAETARIQEKTTERNSELQTKQLQKCMI